jgi:glycine/D-amino acid oxidase-like deaminating enzyme
LVNSNSDNHFDTVIVGQGLAGTLLAWALAERGPERRVLLVDREEAVTSSRVAAGIVTPITGQRLVKSWRLEEMLAAAEGFYRRVEGILGERFFFEKPILRLLANELEVERWLRRSGEADYENWLRKLACDEVRGVRDEFGAFEMRGWQLDVPGFLDASRAWFAERGMYRSGQVTASAAALDPAEDGLGVRELGVVAGELVFCQGWRANEGDLFEWVPFRPGKGELMEVQMAEEAKLETGGRIVNRGGWLLPMGDRRYRCGSTYSWNRVDCVPTQEGRVALEAKLRAMLKPGVEFSVVSQAAAVRPVIRESRALMGRHPGASLERVGFYNGLGSKGVLNGPYFAGQLAGHLVDGVGIEEELDLRRNL